MGIKEKFPAGRPGLGLASRGQEGSLMKRFLAGALTGALLFGGGALYAAGQTKTAYVADYKVLYNGEDIHPSLPVLVVDDFTYLPLRVIADVLNVPIQWNGELRQVEMGAAPGSATGLTQGAYNRTNPAPIGTAQSVAVSNYSENYKATVKVLETKRGDTAWAYIKDANSNNSKPDEGYEYILAKISVSAEYVEDDKALNVSKYLFDCFSAGGEEYSAKTVTTPKPALSAKIFSGGTTEGYVVFQVKATDRDPKIVFGMDRDGTGGVWFALQ